MGLAIVSDGEIAFLLAAVRRAVERSSIRDVARQSGMSHGGIHNIVTGTTNRTYGATIRKLRGWYLHEWARGGDGLTPEVAAYLIEQVLATIEPGARGAAALELVRSLERIYASHQAPRPAWLSAVRDEYGRSGERVGTARGPPRDAHPGAPW
jgi:hypothetical protein